MTDALTVLRELRNRFHGMTKWQADRHLDETIARLEREQAEASVLGDPMARTSLPSDLDEVVTLARAVMALNNERELLIRENGACEEAIDIVLSREDIRLRVAHERGRQEALGQSLPDWPPHELPKTPVRERMATLERENAELRAKLAVPLSEEVASIVGQLRKAVEDVSWMCNPHRKAADMLESLARRVQEREEDNTRLRSEVSALRSQLLDQPGETPR